MTTTDIEDVIRSLAEQQCGNIGIMNPEIRFQYNDLTGQTFYITAPVFAQDGSDYYLRDFVSIDTSDILHKLKDRWQEETGRHIVERMISRMLSTIFAKNLTPTRRPAERGGETLASAYIEGLAPPQDPLDSILRTTEEVPAEARRAITKSCFAAGYGIPELFRINYSTDDSFTLQAKIAVLSKSGHTRHIYATRNFSFKSDLYLQQPREYIKALVANVMRQFERALDGHEYTLKPALISPPEAEPVYADKQISLEFI